MRTGWGGRRQSPARLSVSALPSAVGAAARGYIGWERLFLYLHLDSPSPVLSSTIDTFLDHYLEPRRSASMSGVCTNMFPPKATFSVDDIPDLAGQVMIVTGGNTGIGKETVKVRIALSSQLYMWNTYVVARRYSPTARRFTLPAEARRRSKRPSRS